MNTFYINGSVPSILWKCKSTRNSIPDIKMNTTPRMIIFNYVEKNKESRSISFNLDDNYFNIYSNGHYLGKFLYENDKIVAEWPKNLTKFDKRVIMKQTQDFFGKIS